MPAGAALAIVVLAGAPAAAGGARASGGDTTVVVSGDLRTNLVPKLYALDRAGARQNLSGNDGDWDPAVSPDGTSLALVSARDGYPAIYVSNLDGGDLRRLTDRIDCVAAESQPRWSPDGTRIAFEYSVGALCLPPSPSSLRRRAGRPEYTTREIHPLAIVDLAGQLRTFDVSGWSPKWSPDGTELSYVEEATSILGGVGTTTGVLDVATGVHGSLGPGTSPQWALTGNALALPSGHGLVRVFDASDRLVRTIRARGAAWTRCGLVTSPRGAVVVSPDARDAAFSTATGVAIRRCGHRSSERLAVRGEPVSFSPSGQQLLLRRCRRAVCELRVATARTSVDVRARAQRTGPLWAPGGRSVAFVGVDGSVTLADAVTGKTLVRRSDEPQSQIVLAGWRGMNTLIYGSRTWSPTTDIYRLTLATEAARRLVSAGWSPAVSPADGTLAFARSPGIWLWNGTQGAHLLARTAGYNMASGLAWSPDGRTIAYSTPGAVGIVTLDGSTHRILTVAPVIRVSAWSPDGHWIAYTATDGVWLVHPDGTDNHRFAAQASALQWSLDGGRVAYVTSSGALVVSSAANGDARTIATGIEPESIAWSRDGTQIFATRVATRWPLGSIFTRIVAVAADGSGETPITDGNASISDVAGPDT